MRRLFTVAVLWAVGAWLSVDCVMAQDSGKFYGSKELRQMVVDYGDAMAAVARASVPLGGDSEAEWAADTVAQIWSDCQRRPFDFVQYMADIALMQRYWAYGVIYLPMTINTAMNYQALQEGEMIWRNYVAAAMMQVDRLHGEVRRSGQWYDYFKLHSYSLLMLDIYWSIIDANNGNGIEPSFSTTELMQYYAEAFGSSRPDSLYMAWVVDGTMFINTYLPWIIRFNADDQFVNDTLMPYAYMMDEYNGPVLQHLEGGQPLTIITPEANTAFLRRALPAYTQVVRILERELRKIDFGGQ